MLRRGNTEQQSTAALSLSARRLSRPAGERRRAIAAGGPLILIVSEKQMSQNGTGCGRNFCGRMLFTSLEKRIQACRHRWQRLRNETIQPTWVETRGRR